MKLLVAALLVTAYASPLQSQIIAIPGRSAAGVAEIRVRNGGTVGIVALAVAMNPLQNSEDLSPFAAFFDSVFDKTESIRPGDGRTIPILLRLRPGIQIGELFELPIATAAILTDGNTTGDPVLLSRLMLRRCNRLLAVETAMDMLSDAGRRNVPRNDLLDRFDKLADLMWKWYVPPEQQVGREVYRSIHDQIKQLPDQPVGSPFPPSAFVEEQRKVLNKERVALLASQPALSTAILTRSQ